MKYPNGENLRKIRLDYCLKHCPHENPEPNKIYGFFPLRINGSSSGVLMNSRYTLESETYLMKTGNLIIGMMLV
ncbi:MAG: hypothetical protein ACFE95_13095 [Candidatus Hodarchaeota archaeon]